MNKLSLTAFGSMLVFLFVVACPCCGICGIGNGIVDDSMPPGSEESVTPEPTGDGAVIGGTDSMAAKAAYKGYLNMQVPESVSDFEGEFHDLFPLFLSYAYFTYNASPDYFEVLKNHDQFLEESSHNRKIEETDCKYLPSNYSYWTENEIDLTDKQCFEGVFFPYVHYFIHDPKTGHVDHFVAGMRD
jgi:hypothetical protein